MARDATTQNLLYVSIEGFNDVYVYSYLPAQVKLVGKLTGFKKPLGECVDKKGDVYIVNAKAYNIREYAHGGAKPIATLSDQGSDPIGCSVDATTGNLAVSNSSADGGEGDVSIYKDARGKPEALYSYINIPNSLSYDDKGNLFVDGEYCYYNGTSCSFVFAFAELPKGSRTFRKIRLNPYPYYSGGVQWDGKHIAVGDGANTIYQYTISGKHGTEFGSTTLGGAHEVEQFCIQGTKVVGADNGYADVGFWNYPAGGPPTKKITGLYAPFGVAVSLSQ